MSGSPATPVRWFRGSEEIQILLCFSLFVIRNIRRCDLHSRHVNYSEFVTFVGIRAYVISSCISVSK